MSELWKDIPGYEGLYQVSNTGKIKSLNYLNTKKEHLLKQSLTYDGYPKLALSKNGKKTNFDVHILVAKAFVHNPANKSQVNHIDGNKLNNNASNLEWCTPKENTNHAIKAGLRQASNIKYTHGKEHHGSKPVLQYDLDGNLIKVWDCFSDAARFYNCNPASIVNCTKGRIQTIRGYVWRQYNGSCLEDKIVLPHIRNRESLINKYY